MPRLNRLCCLLPCALAALLGFASPARCGEPDDPSILAEEIDRLTRLLDADRFSVRRDARQRLQTLAARPQSAAVLARRLRLVLKRDVSLEVRAALERLLKPLPEDVGSTRVSDGEVSPQQVALLLARLNHDAFAVRAAAGARLSALCSRDESAAMLVAPLRRALARLDLAGEARRSVQRAYQLARHRWLLSDPAKWPPAPDEKQVASWLDKLTREGGGGPAREHARRALKDALAYEKSVAGIAKLIEGRQQAGGLPVEAQRELQELKDLTRPGLIAEVWVDRELVTVQYLLVDVPQHPAGAPRVTHFDRVDEKTAHCLSGNSLVSGDYPVGSAIAHPSRGGSMFHLMYTPTPRRKFLYDARRETLSVRKRLARLTERTLETWIEQKRLLSELEIQLIQQLDAEAYSRRVGDYLLAVDDKKAEVLSPFAGGSHHAAICFHLASTGTHHAIDGLIKAINARRFSPPNLAEGESYMAWLAAFAIVLRDPWEGADAWLAKHVDRQDKIYTPEEGATADAGATAAALLLSRRGLSPDDFGLVQVPPPQFSRNWGVSLYRFRSLQDRQGVMRWCEKTVR